MKIHAKLSSYFVNEILGSNFEALLRFYSFLEHRKTKWTKNELLMVVLVKYIILKEKKTKIEVKAPLNQIGIIVAKNTEIVTVLIACYLLN